MLRFATRLAGSLGRLGAGNLASLEAAAAARSGKGTLAHTRFFSGFYKDSRGYEHFQQLQHQQQPGAKWRQGFQNNRWWIALGVGSVGGAYYLSAREEVPYTGRKHAILFIGRGQEQRLGRAIFEQQTRLAQAQGLLYPPDHPYTQRVRRIGMEIAKVAGDGHGKGNCEHMRNLEWQFAVIKSDQANAFVAPGGKVVVFSGLLDLLSSEDELAAVLAHEVAHVLARHQAERMSQMNLLYLGRLLLDLLFGLPIPDAALFLGVFLPYSRRAEHEADTIGLRLMSRACYDPAAATTMLGKLHHKEKAMEKAAGGLRMPAFLRTHPLTEDRVDRVKRDLPKVYELYHAAGCDAKRGFATDLMAGLVLPWMNGGGLARRGRGGGAGQEEWEEEF